MIDDLINQFKEEYLDFIKQNYYNDDPFVPFITVVGTELKSDLPSIVHIPIPSDVLKTKKKELSFISDTIPKVFAHIKEQFNPEMVVFCAYADTKFEDKLLSNALYISFENNDESRLNLFEVIENDMSISEDGELKKGVELKEINYEGKLEILNNNYKNLFKIFNTIIEPSDDKEIDL